MSNKRALKRARAYAETWGNPHNDGKTDRYDYEMGAIEACRQGLDPAHYYFYSCSEWLTLALGLGRHDLLTKPYEDPVAAWSRLDSRQRTIVQLAVGDAPWMIGRLLY